MTSIRITIQEDDKARDLIRFLSDIDFLEIQVEKQVETKSDTGTSVLSELRGLWKDRSITLESLREQAWGRGAQ